MSASTHDPAGLPPPRVEEVSAGIFAYIQPDGSWWINNAGFLVESRGVVSVDSCSTERRTRAYLKAIEEVARRPVHTLVNTHHHGDHTHGNYLFGAVTIVAHERTRKEVLAAGLQSFPGVWTGPEWGDIQLAPPSLTYTDGVDLYLDDLRAKCGTSVRQPTPPTTPWCGSRSAPCCSPATSCSTAGRHSC